MKTPLLFFTLATITVGLFTTGFAEEEKATFLGVSTSFVAPAVREYLEIEEGFGIQVHEVVKDSPAAKAGLKKSDVLLRFNDQLLISPEHLSLLVKREENGESVSLAMMRKGVEEVIEVKLGETSRSALMVRPNPDRRTPEHWQEQLKQQQDYWQRRMEQPRQGKSGPEASGKPPAVSVNPGFPVRVFGTEGVIKIDNEKGEVSITNKGDGHEIVIKDSGGKEVFSGPYDSEKGIAGLPEAAQEQLKAMKLDNLKILAPKIVEDAPEKTSSPMPPAPKVETKEIL